MVEPMLVSEGVRKSYGSLEVLSGIDLVVMPGQVTCLIDPPGLESPPFCDA